MVDPLILRLVAICFALLFLLAAVHKLTASQSFRATLMAYEILPDVLVAPVSFAVAITEAGLGIAWLLDFQKTTVAIASAVLLAGYSAAIAFNLLRGRVHIDCGCGMGKSTGGDSQLSWGLVVRNVILIAAALATTLPAPDRTFGVLDYVTLVAGLLSVVFMYAAANQLLGNNAAIGAWRNRHE